MSFSRKKCPAKTLKLYSEEHVLKFVKCPGADPGFFLGGGALVSCSTSESCFYCRISVVLENRRSSWVGGGGGGEGAHPLRPPLDPPLIPNNL